MARLREQEDLRMILCDVAQAWLNFVFVGSDSEDMTDSFSYDVAEFFGSDDAP